MLFNRSNTFLTSIRWHGSIDELFSNMPLFYVYKSVLQEVENRKQSILPLSLHDCREAKIAEKHIAKFVQSGLINHFAHDT
jgi:hypothetical protein